MKSPPIESVTLVVGGERYVFTPAQLQTHPNSFFSGLMDHLDTIPPEKTEDDAYVLQRDPAHFSTIAEYLRSGESVVSSLKEKSTRELLSLRQIVDYDNLTDLLACIDAIVDERDAERAMLTARVAELETSEKTLVRRVSELGQALTEARENYRAVATNSIPYNSIDCRYDSELVKLGLCVYNTDPYRQSFLCRGLLSPRGYPTVSLMFEL
jgi:hypothetical protein